MSDEQRDVRTTVVGAHEMSVAVGWEGSDDELLNVAQAAALLTVKPSTLRYWAAEGRVPVIRLGPRHLRWTRPLLREIRDAAHAPARRI